MNIQTKKHFFCAAALVFLLAAAHTETKTPEITSALKSIMGELEAVFPENSSLLGVQPDAYIGKLFPSVPPHFTAGLSVSGTFVDTGFLSDNVQKIGDSISDFLSESGVVDTLSIDFDMPERIPYPSAGISARLGGIFLPFDIGLYGITTIGNVLDSIEFDDVRVSIDYTTFGADVRYALYEGNLFLPKISVGAGYMYSRQEMKFKISQDFTTKASYGSAEEHSVSANVATHLDMTVATHTVFAQVQVSKKLFIFTPFIGFKAAFTASEYDGSWSYSTKIKETEKSELSDSDKFSCSNSFFDTGIQPQVFGGLGIDLAFFQIAVNLSYNMRSYYTSGSVLLAFKM